MDSHGICPRARRPAVAVLPIRLHLPRPLRCASQILCKLLQPCAVMLLDEITTDLDLLARQDLLEWLKEEAEQRGACVVYCTHIFDGLDGWASELVPRPRSAGGLLGRALPAAEAGRGGRGEVADPAARRRWQQRQVARASARGEVRLSGQQQQQ